MGLLSKVTGSIFPGLGGLPSGNTSSKFIDTIFPGLGGLAGGEGLFGGGLGNLFGGGQPKEQTVTSISAPWEGVADYLKGKAPGPWGAGTYGLFPEAERLYANYTPSYFPGQTVAPMSRQTDWALRGLEDRALNRSPLTLAAQNQGVSNLQGNYLNASPIYGSPGLSFLDAAAQGKYTHDNPLYGSAGLQQLEDTARGNYLYGGPGFNAAMQAASDRIIPQVSSLFSSSGRLGSGLAQEAQTRALSNAFADLYGQERGRQVGAAQAASGLRSSVGLADRATQLAAAQYGSGLRQNAYDAERNRQLQSMGMAPQLAAQDYIDIQALGSAGAQREAQQQDEINAEMDRFNFYQNLPYERLNRFASIINPTAGIGGSQMQTSPLYRNKGAGLLGGALAGAQLGSVVPGLGTGFGAGIGGLLGLMG